MQPKELLFILLRSALSGEALTEENKRIVEQHLTKEALEALFALSKKHDVAPLLAHSLEANGLLLEKKELFAPFSKEKMFALFRYENMAHELSALKDTLSQNEIPFMPLKGAVLRRLYAEPFLRTSCDIDILVRDADLPKAAQALCDTLKYKQKGERNFHDLSLYSESGVHLELHHNILENVPALDRTLARVWEHSAPLNEGGYEYAQSPAFLVFHIIAHMAYHFLCGGCGIRPFADLYLLKKEHAYKDEDLALLLEESDLKTFFAHALSLCEVWFEGAPHTEQTLQMEAYLLCGGAYGTVKNSIAAKRQKGGKVYFVFSRLFVSYDYLKNLYPVLHKHKWLYPFMQIRRWGRLLFGGRLKRSVKQVQISQQTDAAEAERIVSLMESLGLSL